MADPAYLADPQDQTRGRDDNPATPPTRPAAPLSPGEKPDQLEHAAESRDEALVDQAVEETFPASDPATGKHIT